jgi:hypothetical protein
MSRDVIASYFVEVKATYGNEVLLVLGCPQPFDVTVLAKPVVTDTPTAVDAAVTSARPNRAVVALHAPDLTVYQIVLRTADGAANARSAVSAAWLNDDSVRFLVTPSDLKNPWPTPGAMISLSNGEGPQTSSKMAPEPTDTVKGLE